MVYFLIYVDKPIYSIMIINYTITEINIVEKNKTTFVSK